MVRNMNINRIKMCKDKVSFTNEKAARKVAKLHDQRVYECPVCFCFHCTSSDNWKGEYVTRKEYEIVMTELIRKRKKVAALGLMVQEKDQRINELKRKLKEYKHE